MIYYFLHVVKRMMANGPDVSWKKVSFRLDSNL